jgi:hypothetical protein
MTVKRRSGPAALGAAVLLAVLGAGTTGCTGSDEASSGAPATTAAASTTVAPTSTGAPATTTGGPATTEGPATTGAPAGGAAAGGEAATLADGRHAVFIESVADAKRTMVVDEVQFLTGAAAAKAAAQDGKESPPPNDYYIRNLSPRTRSLRVAPNVRITVNGLTAEETGSATQNVPLDLTELASYFPNPERPLFWVTVQGGQVQRIEQRFLP